jgi:hypothetical protein
MLRIASLNSEGHLMALTLNECFGGIFDFIFNAAAVAAKEERNLLELVYKKWLRVHLEAARLAAGKRIATVGEEKLTLARILGLGDFQGYGACGKILRSVFCQQIFTVNADNASSPVIPVRLKFNSWKSDSSPHLSELQGMEVDADDPIALIYPSNSTTDEEA